MTYNHDNVRALAIKIHGVNRVIEWTAQLDAEITNSHTGAALKNKYGNICKLMHSNANYT